MHQLQRYIIAALLGIVTLGVVLQPKNSYAQGELETGIKEQPGPAKIAFLVKDERMLRSSVMSAVEMLKGQGYPVEKATVVVVGPALKLLEKGSDAESQMRKAMQNGLEIDACEVAMSHMDIKPNQLLDGVKPVDNGFFEIFRLQRDGYQTLEL